MSKRYLKRAEARELLPRIKAVLEPRGYRVTLTPEATSYFVVFTYPPAGLKLDGWHPHWQLAEVRRQKRREVRRLLYAAGLGEVITNVYPNEFPK